MMKMSNDICPKCGKRRRTGSVGTTPKRDLMDVVNRSFDRGFPPGLQGMKYGIPGDPSTWAERPGVAPGTLDQKTWVPDRKHLKRHLSIDSLRHEQGKHGEVFDLHLVEFVMKQRPGDEVWWYDDFGFAGPLSGAQGYVLLRNGRVVAMLTTAVS